MFGCVVERREEAETKNKIVNSIFKCIISDGSLLLMSIYY